jgi:hypothetical protein
MLILKVKFSSDEHLNDEELSDIVDDIQIRFDSLSEDYLCDEGVLRDFTIEDFIVSSEKTDDK